ncbi:MAG TPA: aminotransferase class V-fold PLP-dependent enzyme [Methanoregulaceae archaeon]|nr:aminotransferase class V-fold PLP-dependent enzyme [Methanoregulaceae archaeon]HQJ87295.1 aminotransferase class V-fold PLP-dependent enzyme [Methanoregulaceae archaeon]
MRRERERGRAIDPHVKKTLYWCPDCNVPLLGRICASGHEGVSIPLLEPYDVRPALKADYDLIAGLVRARFGDVPVPRVLLLNKTGGLDRNELVIANGTRFGWLSFDPVTRTHRFDPEPGALPGLIGAATKGVIDLDRDPKFTGSKVRLGGKRVRISTSEPDGPVIVHYRGRYGTGQLADGWLRVRELVAVQSTRFPDPGWEIVVDRNRLHLKNLERQAVRTIRAHLGDRPRTNVSFSGGKDSTAVLALARKAGVSEAFFIDTGLEFPETLDFVRSMGVLVIEKGGDFFLAAERAGPPGKDNRWCCKLLKLHPLKRHLATIGPCVTIQGNRWYESWNRAGLDETSQNPNNPLQLNVSPIRHWRALEVWLYIWWRGLPVNPLYAQGFERLGCYLCPAMLEAEQEQVRRIHPELAGRWDAFLAGYARARGLPGEFVSWGLWRWKVLPKKMAELCRQHGLEMTPDGELAPIRSSSPPVSGKVTAGPVQDEVSESGAAPRRDFPILGDTVYLDSAATSLSPGPVIDAMVEFDRHYRSNVGRGVHRLAQLASQRYWHAREKVELFINGRGGTTVFTRNSTEAIGIVAQGLSWQPSDRVVTTVLEHHSNLLPWLRLRSRGVEVEVIDIGDDLLLDIEALEAAIDKRTRLVAVTHASNAVGTITPIEEIGRICRERGALLLVDGAQSVPHLPVDVQRLGIDYLAFSGHKMLGPTGTGVLWMREPVPEPLLLGGGAVELVSEDGWVLAPGPARFEAGTPNIAGAIGLGAAVDYLSSIGMDAVRTREERLTTRLIDDLRGIDGVRVFAPFDPETRIGVVSFTVDGFHPHEVAQYLSDELNVMVRSGLHCCEPLMRRLGLPGGTVRASLHCYSNAADIETLLAGVEECAHGA